LLSIKSEHTFRKVPDALAVYALDRGYGPFAAHHIL
jgi:hypothetical protein